MLRWEKPSRNPYDVTEWRCELKGGVLQGISLTSRHRSSNGPLVTLPRR